MMQRSSHIAVVAIAALLVASLGCKRKDQPTQAATAPVVHVQTAAISQVEAPLTLRLPGNLRGRRETDLAANATGRVLTTLVERGSRVKAGQVLAQLDVRAASSSAAEANAQAESARASAAQLKLECARAEQLHSAGSISQAELERITAQCRTSSFGVEASSARARLAAQNVGDGSIRAPFAGVVSERYVDVGEFVRPDSRVVTIVASDELRLELAVPEADASKVREGAEVRFRVAGFPQRDFFGKVRFVSGAIREATRDLVVEALVENPDGVLKPGMFADVELQIGTETLPSVPKAATVEKDGHVHAFFVEGDRLHERVLSTLPAIGDAYPIKKGAKPGETVALGDLRTLENGQHVR